MKIISWNVRQVNNSSQKGIIKQVFSYIHLDWVGIQESKLGEVDYVVIDHIFGADNTGFAFSPSINSLGGGVFCWNLYSFSKTSSICFHRMIVVKGTWTTRDGPEVFLCIYASNNLPERKAIFILLSLLCSNGLS